MKITVLTLGCKTNLAESDDIKRHILASGHELVELKDSPELCIINTCSVTAKSDYQSRQLIRRAIKSGARVVVTGCYTELDEMKIKEISPDIEVIKNSDKNKILQLVSNDYQRSTLKLSGRARPFVKIQEGCSHRCTYCIIPELRGRPKSRPPEEIIREVVLYESSGYDEVVLTGIHIGLYGVDLKGRVNLQVLLEGLLNHTKRIRIRLSSLEVIEISQGFLEVFADKRVCKHLHIPLQSGSDSVLKRMKRPYNTKTFELVVKDIYKRFDNISIGTDVIVGFPGETEEEFCETLKLLEDLPINYMHIFPYSDRPGTVASGMRDKVPKSTKKERAQRLRELDSSRREQYRALQIGKTLRVVAERTTRDGYIKGKSDNYLDVYYRDSDFREGRASDVKILSSSEGVLFGKAQK